jgi:hypothetical protein
VTEAVFTLPQPDDLAQGLINNSVAPACPDRCSLPAHVSAAERKINAPLKTTLRIRHKSLHIFIMVCKD